MNQIINMIIRQVMNQLVRRGINAGFDQASKMGKRKQHDLPVDALDDYGNPVDHQQMARQQRQERRQSKQATRQAGQSMKVMRRVTKF